MMPQQHRHSQPARPESSEEVRLQQTEQSLSEMVLASQDPQDSDQPPPPQDIPASRDSGSVDSPSVGVGGGRMEQDLFARERQKRLLPSNTVALSSSGSSEGRAQNAGSPKANANSSPSGLYPGPVGDEQQQRLDEMCRTLIRDMNKYGVCVLDEFLGEERGQKVLSEVVTMYSEGKFKDGQLVTPSTKTGAEIRDLKHIRGDKITWVGGREPGCSHIGYLINQVDAVITMANKMKDNGKLGQFQIKERTKGMVACYPGSGTHYVKHVDNPTRDGRCITAIYYLNPNWDAKTSGGLLRMFPENLPIVDIAPQFDRILFFWSDRRNPHEVQPAHRTRYAITLWYHDAAEREQALQRYQREMQVNQGTTPTKAKAGGGGPV